MDYAHAKTLKVSLMGETLSGSILVASGLPRAAADASVSARVVTRPRMPFAIGLRGAGNNYRLAVRIQSADPGIEQAVDRVRRRARGECDVEVVGRVVKQAKLWHQRKNRPLQIGGSIGHFSTTAGTLGCFVTDRTSGNELILSNNHVLANENNANRGDAIVQPGPLDGGRRPRDTIGELQRFARLKRRGNTIDAATALMRDSLEYYFNWLESRGELAGVRTEPLDEDELVYKIGRTTGLTRGRVNAIEVDGLRVQYDMGVVEFDGQIQIAPADNEPFSLGGDSGSLIFDRHRRAVALLFAGNDVDATFASPIATVLNALRVNLSY